MNPQRGASPPGARGRPARTQSTARALFLLSGLFIFYATTIPWDFSRPPSFDRVSWVPFWDSVLHRRASISDLVQNVLLFIPFGGFGVLSLASVRRRGAARGSLLIGLVGLSLSLVVEGLQTMSLERLPSVSDLMTNFTGTLAGAAMGFVYLSRFHAPLDAWTVRMARERPGRLLCLVATIAVAAGALAPFVPSLDVSDVRANVRQLLDHPWGLKLPGALVGDALAFGALAFLVVPEVPRRAVAWANPRAISPVAAVLVTVIGISLFAAALEVGQLVIVGHSPGVQDAVAGLVGAVIGAGFAVVTARGVLSPARELGGLCTRAPALAVGFAVLVPAVRALAPFELVAPAEKLGTISPWQLVPFWATFRNVTVGTVLSVVEAGLHYVPIGYVMAALGRRRATAFALALVLAEALEVLQIGIAGRTFDVTEGLFAGAGALIGAWAFQRLRDRGRSPEGATTT